MFRSATFKLTVYYLAIIAIITVGFSFAVYQIGTNDLAFGLQRQTQRLSNDFPVFSGSPYLRMGRELHEGDAHLVQQLVIFNILVLAAAGFASYGLARRTLQPIELAHERQKRFTADVSHELRTPLTALKMESEVALLDPAASKSELRSALTSTVEEAEKLTLLIKNLLRLSQLEATEDSHLTIVLLAPIIETAMSQLQSTASSRHITLTNDLDTGVRVAADSDTLTQLLVILIDNAIKYSPTESIVAITGNAQDSMASITVADSGIGIPKTDLEHVFERFYRADSARSTSNSSGFGLGLSIAKLIADSHHATISLTSRVGQGTVAKVVLPLVVETAVPRPVRVQRKALPTKPASRSVKTKTSDDPK